MKFIFTVSMLFISALSLAQEAADTLAKSDTATYKSMSKFPVFSTDYFRYPNSDYDTNTGKGKVKMNELRTSFQIPVQLKKGKTYLLNRIKHSIFSYKAKIESRNLSLDETFQSFEYTLGLIQILPKRWTLIANITPTIASDFEKSLNSDDFILQASALMMKRSSQNFQYGFGFAFTTRFGSGIVIPIVNMAYKKNNWETLVVIPAYIAQNYNINENAKIGLKAAVYGNLYNATFDDNMSTLDLMASYSRINIGPDFRLKLFGDLYLNVGAGIAVRNILEIQDEKSSTQLDFDIDRKPFFNIGLKLLK